MDYITFRYVRHEFVLPTNSPRPTAVVLMLESVHEMADSGLDGSQVSEGETEQQDLFNLLGGH